MIDMKALLADRQAGTQGPFETCVPGDYSDYDGDCIVLLGDDLRIAVVLGAHDEALANYRRFARVPELEKALIDARAALEACRNLFAIMIRDHDDEETIESSKIMLAICKKGLGE